MTKMNNYTVYKHTTPNNKVYIGITKQSDVKRRWLGGSGYVNNEHFYKAIKKYGWENIRHEIIAEALTEEEAQSMEMALIAKYHSNNKAFGYNKTSGGEAGKTYTEESKKNISNALKKVYLERPELKRFGSENPMFGKRGADNPNYGRKASAETCSKISAKAKERVYTEEIRKKMSDSHKGTTKDAATKAKISESHKKPVRCIETGIIYPSIGEAQKAIPNCSKLGAVCLEKRETAGGYHWEYYNANETNKGGNEDAR